MIEIASATISHMDDFRVIAGHMGKRVVTLVSSDLDPESDDQDSMHRDYRVSVAEVLATLRRELGQAAAP